MFPSIFRFLFFVLSFVLYSFCFLSVLFTFIAFFFIPYVPYCPFLTFTSVLQHAFVVPQMSRLYTTTAVKEFSRVVISTGTSRSRMWIYQTVLHYEKSDIQKHEKRGDGVMFISTLLFQIFIWTGGQQKCLKYCAFGKTPKVSKSRLNKQANYQKSSSCTCWYVGLLFKFWKLFTLLQISVFLRIIICRQITTPELLNSKC